MRKVHGQILFPAVLYSPAGVGHAIPLGVCIVGCLRLRKNEAAEGLGLLGLFMIQPADVIIAGLDIDAVLLPVPRLVKRVVRRTIRLRQKAERVDRHRVQARRGNDAVEKRSGAPRLCERPRSCLRIVDDNGNRASARVPRGAGEVAPAPLRQAHVGASEYPSCAAAERRR